MAAGDVRAVAAGQLAGVPRVAADGGPPLMALRARSCRRRRRRCRGRLRSGARALPAAHAACAAPCPDRWACSMSSARPRHQQDTHHAQSPAVGDVADGLGRPRRGARGRMRREGVGELPEPEREEFHTPRSRPNGAAVCWNRSSHGWPFRGPPAETDLRRRCWRNGSAAQPSSQVAGLAGK